MSGSKPSRYGTEVLSASDQELLMEPLTLPFSGKVIKNRFCKAALSESLARSDGQIDKSNMDCLVNLYEAWAKGGSGLILTGNVMVDRTMREMECNVSVEDERDLGRLQFWAQSVQKHGAALYAQISHPGRQSHGHLTKEPVAPSAIPFPNFHSLMTFNDPRALSTKEVQDLVQSFIRTSVVLHKAGFDGVEVHAAHGYLISQFLNPRTNERTDEYGGSLENRSRFLMEIVRGVKEATPKEFSVGVKLNSVDFGRRRSKDDVSPSPRSDTATTGVQNDGKDSLDEDLEEAVQVSIMLEKLGVDFIEISGGSYESWTAGLMDGKPVAATGKGSATTQPSERTQKREAHFAVFAERISTALQTTKIILTGGFITARAMADSLKTATTVENSQTSSAVGRPHIDMIGLGRPVCAEPDLPNQIVSGSVTGAIIMPKLPGGFMDDVFLAGGNIRRMARGKWPVWSLSKMLFSAQHVSYALGYSKVGIQKIKSLL